MLCSSQPSRNVMPWCGQFRRGHFFLVLAVGLLSLANRASAIVPWTSVINTTNIIVVTNSPYNALGDGVTTNTTAIQNAIKEALI